MARLFDRHRTRILHQKKHSGAITPPEELSDQEEDQLEPEQEIPRHSHGGGGSYGVVTIDGRRSWDMVVCEACGASSLAAQILIISEREGQSRWIPAPIWSVSTLVPPYNDLPSFDVSTAEGSYDLCVFLINIVEDHPIINMKALRKKKDVWICRCVGVLLSATFAISYAVLHALRVSAAPRAIHSGEALDWMRGVSINLLAAGVAGVGVMVLYLEQ